MEPESQTVDLPTYLRHHPQAGQAVFFIHGIDQGGSDTERFLNYRREYLIEDKQRLLIWAHETAATQLAQKAPDFWAFHGRAIEFLEQLPLPKQTELTSKLLDQLLLELIKMPSGNLVDSIHLREKLLDELPTQPAYSKNRLGLLSSLALLYYQAGDSQTALARLNQAETLLTPEISTANTLSSLQMSRGIILFSQKQYTKAISSLKSVLKIETDNHMARLFLAASLTNIQEYDEALSTIEQVTRLDQDEHHLSIAKRLQAYIFLQTGQFYKAIFVYEQLAKQNPDDKIIHQEWQKALAASRMINR